MAGGLGCGAQPYGHALGGRSQGGGEGRCTHTLEEVQRQLLLRLRSGMRVQGRKELHALVIFRLGCSRVEGSRQAVMRQVSSPGPTRRPRVSTSALRTVSKLSMACVHRKAIAVNRGRGWRGGRVGQRFAASSDLVPLALVNVELA
jgi:hypothetical protein